MKRIPILPTLVTLGNAFCGFIAIGYVVKAQILWDSPGVEEAKRFADFAQWIGWAGWMIIFAMVFDALDGKVARLSQSTSDFGAELDSLCDVISFGVAPAMIIRALAVQQNFLPRIAIGTSALFMMCAALRLARFNIEMAENEESHFYFRGLPAPGAAAFIATMTILFDEIRAGATEKHPLAILAREALPVMNKLLYVMPFIAVILALLMISRLRYIHLLNRLLRDREPFDYVVKVLILAVAVALTRPFSLPILVGIYILSGITMWVKEKLLRWPHRKPTQPEIPPE